MQQTTGMKFSKSTLFALLMLPLLFSVHLVRAQDLDPTPTLGGVPNVGDIINAINSLRLSYGLTPLNAHPVLMDIAQQEASGIAQGLPGHWRPNGLTLGQWMMSLGYPLSGDLTLDGYRSENWVQAYTAEEAVNAWLGDDLHTNTMLSVDRSDIGAGVAVGDDVFFIVIETALQTRNGQIQSNAADILTGIPMTRAAYSQMETQAAINGVLPQYSVPVSLSTPFPDGKVYHEVLYGQTLWSIAIAYHTTIKGIQSLNNLGDSTTLYEGQVLLVQTGATQSASNAASTGTSTLAASPVFLSTLTMTPSPTETPNGAFQDASLARSGTSMGIVAIILSALFLAGVFAAMTRKKPI